MIRLSDSAFSPFACKVRMGPGVSKSLISMRLISMRPSFRLHRLKGKLRGFWAVTVRANWRIVFRFEDGRAFDVDFLDYH